MVFGELEEEAAATFGEGVLDGLFAGEVEAGGGAGDEFPHLGGGGETEGAADGGFEVGLGKEPAQREPLEEKVR